MHGERINGFPTRAPKVTLAKALNTALGNAANAKELTAYYVLHTWAGAYKDRPVWIIQLRGIPVIPPLGIPFGAPEDAVPRKFLDHTRTIVDAMTGELIIADHIPQPR